MENQVYVIEFGARLRDLIFTRIDIDLNNINTNVYKDVLELAGRINLKYEDFLRCRTVLENLNIQRPEENQLVDTFMTNFRKIRKTVEDYIKTKETTATK